MCSTQTASASAAGPFTRYPLSFLSSFLLRLPSSPWDQGVSENPGWGGYWLTRAFRLFPPYLSLPLSPRVSASLQDRMVLLVMGNIINWSL